jgi:hypothetical protein
MNVSLNIFDTQLLTILVSGTVDFVVHRAHASVGVFDKVLQVGNVSSVDEVPKIAVVDAVIENSVPNSRR